MSQTLNNIQDEASHLSRRERAHLALRLLEGLEPGHDEDVDDIWLDEAERRLERYDRGVGEARDAEDGIDEIERSIE